MHAAVARRVLRRQAEGVPAHGVHDLEAAGALVARHHVAQRVVADVPHVYLAAGVGEHLQHVVLGPPARRQVLGAEAPGRVPGGLPARLGRGEVVGGGIGVRGRGIHGALYPATATRRQRLLLPPSGMVGARKAERALPASVRAGTGLLCCDGGSGGFPDPSPLPEGERAVQFDATWLRSSRARARTLFSISLCVTGLTGASTQVPPRAVWRNTETLTPSARNWRPRM